jgi:hypothetical protein
MQAVQSLCDEAARKEVIMLVFTTIQSSVLH